jgi:hypothetical protein
MSCSWVRGEFWIELWNFNGFDPPVAMDWLSGKKGFVIRLWQPGTEHLILIQKWMLRLRSNQLNTSSYIYPRELLKCFSALRIGNYHTAYNTAAIFAQSSHRTSGSLSVCHVNKESELVDLFVSGHYWKTTEVGMRWLVLDKPRYSYGSSKHWFGIQWFSIACRLPRFRMGLQQETGGSWTKIPSRPINWKAKLVVS